MKLFAAIDVGSYALEMKIFEMSAKTGIKEIDCIGYQLDLGSDTYATHRLPLEKVDELCRVLKEFKKICDSYQVDAYKAYGTSAVREMENVNIILDQIRQRTGLVVEVLSNSEQRFLNYKAVAKNGEIFNRMLEAPTAIVDIGGGSTQISLFEQDSLVTTQNLRLGVLRLQENLGHVNVAPGKYDVLLEELINGQLSVYKKLYLKDKNITNVIVVDGYLSYLASQSKYSDTDRIFPAKKVPEFKQLLSSMSYHEISKEMNLPIDRVSLTSISCALLSQICGMMSAETVWVPSVTLTDGIAYEYAEQNKLMKASHDFEQDIMGCVRNISKRYMGSRKRGETLEQIALRIFDAMKKIHGLGERERLLLRIATLLHDCGKYISMNNLGECSYQIILSTEIIGLSHAEREIVANVVKYNHSSFGYYEVISGSTSLSKEEYLKVAKLTAILRLANGLDRSHKQKFKNVKVTLKDEKLIFAVDTQIDVMLEKGLFEHRADFFQEVFSIKPVIKQKAN